MRLANASYFYKLPEEERLALVGKSFVEDNYSGSEFFPLLMSEEGINDNGFFKQGLIHVSQTRCVEYGKRAGEDFFKVESFSPLYNYGTGPNDIGLEFHSSEVRCRKSIILMIKENQQVPQTYSELMNTIHKKFRGDLV